MQSDTDIGVRVPGHGGSAGGGAKSRHLGEWMCVAGLEGMQLSWCVNGFVDGVSSLFHRPQNQVTCLLLTIM